MHSEDDISVLISITVLNHDAFEWALLTRAAKSDTIPRIYLNILVWVTQHDMDAVETIMCAHGKLPSMYYSDIHLTSSSPQCKCCLNFLYRKLN